MAAAGARARAAVDTARGSLPQEPSRDASWASCCNSPRAALSPRSAYVRSSWSRALRAVRVAMRDAAVALSDSIARLSRPAPRSRAASVPSRFSASASTVASGLRPSAAA